MKICHVGIMGNIRKEGMITQYLFENCEGEHIYHSLSNHSILFGDRDISRIKEPIPKADIYILHCMKNLLYLEKFITFDAPGKIISLVHSSEPCMPSKNSDLVVVLTHVWKERLKRLYDIDSVVIPGGIDIDRYKPRIEPKKLAFGKITRAEPGKFHKSWNDIVLRTLKKNKKAECRIICNGYKKLNYLKHRRMKWVEGVTIGSHEKKIAELSKLSVYTECHADCGSAFVDTFNMSMLEAMALGIPAIMYKGNGIQEPMAEVKMGVGVFLALNSYESMLNILLTDKCIRDKMSIINRDVAEHYSHKKMINAWNEVLC